MPRNSENFKFCQNILIGITDLRRRKSDYGTLRKRISGERELNLRKMVLESKERLKLMELELKLVHDNRLEEKILNGSYRELGFKGIGRQKGDLTKNKEQRCFKSKQE